jgi:hypothetical protein
MYVLLEVSLMTLTWQKLICAAYLKSAVMGPLILNIVICLYIAVSGIILLSYIVWI